jgi:hypothetical protein
MITYAAAVPAEIRRNTDMGVAAVIPLTQNPTVTKVTNTVAVPADSVRVWASLIMTIQPTQTANLIHPIWIPRIVVRMRKTGAVAGRNAAKRIQKMKGTR